MVVEIWSDIACPWCYVGKRRFEAALAGFDHEVEVVWRSFELDPGAPASREVSAAEHLSAKYGRTLEEVAAMDAQLTAVAAADGLEMRFAQLRSGNTFDGHRLVHLAAAHGRQDAMVERLQRAHFTDGELLSDHATLARLADELGVPGAAEMLASDGYTAEVRDDERLAQEIGISAVPTFVVDRRVAVAGAQQPEVLRQLLERGLPVS